MCEEGFKRCSKCEEVKSVSEFSKDRRSKDGYKSRCKECAKRYREENKEKIAERGRRYYDKNKEKIAERRKPYREENKEKIAECTKRYRGENKEWLAENKKQYYEENKEWFAKYHKQYAKTSAGIETKKRSVHKRRGFGFSPINNYFEGSEFHHLHINFEGCRDHNIGIFIPAELHQSIFHNSFTWAGMDEMNNKAIEWYNENYNVVNYIDKCNSQRSLLDFY